MNFFDQRIDRREVVVDIGIDVRSKPLRIRLLYGVIIHEPVRGNMITEPAKAGEVDINNLF